ncbi:hypothetical protein [Mesorhizobium xinjiangense]|uniref:hypothetical protein n=1 Tax=Mesorhizobium xinjiangense TaxID=2678685 RepID=UPI0012EE7E10|nr:hypothetical protein [Mesorhizobium xinjiangense]
MNSLRLPAAAAIALSAAAFLGGCVSDPEPDQMARTNLKTAPADLQLLCANAAATSTGVEDTKVLPLRSRQLDSGTYQVDLDAGGTMMSCIIDGEGNVQSVQPS